MGRPSVIVLGAGRPFTGTDPSALQFVSSDRRVLDWLVDAFESSLEDPDIHFVGGYRVDDVVDAYPDIDVSRNEEWRTTGTVGSFLSAPLDGDEDTYVCYADVVFQPDVVSWMAATEGRAVVAVDESWRTRYHARSEESRERAEKVRYGNGVVERISTELEPGGADAEFTGLTRLSPGAMRSVRDLVDRGIIGPEQDLPDLLTALAFGGVEPTPVDVDGNWAELETAEDLARFILDTKANTLRRLESVVTESTIAPQFTCTVEEFEVDPGGVLAAIREQFDARVIVRSSTLAEDGWERSNAGRFESVLDVPTDDDDALLDAIQTVVASYDGNPENQVLVQPMVEGVAASGVAMTRSIERASPYYVINYDATSGSTVTVTDGSGDDIRTVVVRKDAAGEFAGDGTTTPPTEVNVGGGVTVPEGSSLRTEELVGDPDLQLPALLRAIRELETVVGHDSLDIEFAVTDGGEVYLLQVRPMTVDPGERAVDDETVIRAVDRARTTFTESQRPLPVVLGGRTIYGVMPDWNPAEIIGRTPRSLAASLYRYLVTDEIWARQRAEFGYRDVRPQPLMRSFAGQPYVDVRADFNSFVPASVPDELAERLVDFYLSRLEANPHFHDKVEFEVVLTCLSFDFEYRAEPLVEAGFSDDERSALREGLREITVGAFERAEIGRDLEDIAALERRFNRVKDADVPHLEAARTLLSDCRRLGTLPFAHLARTAFVAVTLLRSLERKGVLSADDSSRFLNSLNTVARQFEADGYRVSNGELSFDEFVEEYGHLRPGTYDITSPQYASDPDGYLRPTVEAATAPEQVGDPADVWDADTKEEIARELEGIGLPPDADRFVSFLREAIEGREYSKFVFTKNISEALERIAAFGLEHGFGREELSHVSIGDLLELTTDPPAGDVHAWLERRVDEGRERHAVAQAVELPSLLCREADFVCFERPAQEPNFVTAETVRAELAEPEVDADVALDGRVVMIPQADPGYDWLFGYELAGLVTMYGGVNSHMAIRAAEFGLPSAVGIGETRYRQLSGAEVVELDCQAGTIEKIR